MSKAVTLRMLQGRLATIARNLDEQDLEPDPALGLEIDGKAIPVNNENFQIDDDGTLEITTHASAKFAVVEAISGTYVQGFKSHDEARDYVLECLENMDPDDDYDFRTVMVCDEWSSANLLPGEGRRITEALKK